MPRSPWAVFPELHRQCLTPLPYAENALEPVITANTVGFHYGRHHKGSVDNLNKLIAGTEYADLSLENDNHQYRRTVRKSRDFQQRGANLQPHVLLEKHEIEGRRRTARRTEVENGGILRQRGRLQKGACRRGRFTVRGRLGLACSQWRQAQGSKDRHADVPLTTGMKPLLTVDVWEHASSLDYQNHRADYVNAVGDKLINWEFALQSAS